MYNLAIIGCGRISYKHVEATVDNSENLNLIAVCDIIESRAKERAEQYNEFVKKTPKIYTDYKKMLESENIDIVVICTESGYHAKIALFCLNNGKHVLVEKPMALSTEDAENMVLSALQNNLKLCVAHQNRFNRPILKLKEAVDKGRFGKIIAGHAHVLWNRDQSYYSQAAWRGTYELDGGCLMNQCIHNIDLLQWILGGEILWLNGDVENHIHSYIEAEDYGSIQIKFKTGAIGSVEGTVCVYPQNFQETLTIIGENGTVSIGGIAVNKIETWRFSDGMDVEEDVIIECGDNIDNVYGNGHSPLYRDFIESISENRKPMIDGVDGKIAMEIVLATYKSSKEKCRINFPIKDINCTDFR